MVVFAIIGTMGIDMLRKVDLHERGNMFILAARADHGSAADPGAGPLQQVSRRPAIVLGNGLAMGAITAVLLNLMFHHFGIVGAARLPPRRRPRRRDRRPCRSDGPPTASGADPMQDTQA